jgi:hypothetical protein
MRPVPYTLCLAATLMAAGCTDSKWALFRNSKDDGRYAKDNPTAVDLVAYLNTNSQKIRSIECQYLEMDIKQGTFGQSFGIPQGKMICEKPKNFRMMAGVAGHTEADIGSNENEFWYWIARNDPPYLVHCSYKDLEQGVRIPFPFQPEWVMETLGMAEFGSGQEYQLAKPRDRDTIELVRNTTSQGQRVQKVIEFSRVPAKVQVRAHRLRDAKGNEICSAQILDVGDVNGAIVPRVIVLSYRAEKLELKLSLFRSPQEITLNRQYDASQTAALFTRPTLSGVRDFDLARDTYNPGNQIRPAGGFSQR